MMDAKYRQQIEQLYVQMYDKMLLYARSTLGGTPSAEEAVQETFRIACMRPEALCTSPNPQGWLVTALKHVLSNTERNRQSAKHLLVEYLTLNADVLTVARDRISFQVLYADVLDLEEFRLIQEMVLEGKSHLELAQARGISVDACKKRVQRAKKKLRLLMER